MDQTFWTIGGREIVDAVYSMAAAPAWCLHPVLSTKHVARVIRTDRRPRCGKSTARSPRFTETSLSVASAKAT
jgi:hypothetical protein